MLVELDHCKTYISVKQNNSICRKVSVSNPGPKVTYYSIYKLIELKLQIKAGVNGLITFLDLKCKISHSLLILSFEMWLCFSVLTFSLFMQSRINV